MGLNFSFANGYTPVSNTNVPPAHLLRFLREHRYEWADNNIDAYSAAAVKLGPCGIMGSRTGNYGGQTILPLAHTVENEELLEVIKLEGVENCPEAVVIMQCCGACRCMLLSTIPAIIVTHNKGEAVVRTKLPLRQARLLVYNKIK